MRTLNLLLASQAFAPPDGSSGGSLERLGSIKPVEASPGNGAALVELVNVQRTVVLGLAEDLAAGRRTQAEQAEQIEKMSTQLRTKVGEVRASAGALWVPEGGAAELDRRYFVGGEIGVRLGSRKIQVPVITDEGIETVERIEHGLLTEPHTVTPEHERVRDAYIAYALTRVLGVRQPARFRTLMRVTSLKLREAMIALPGQTGEWARAVFNDPAALKRVMNSTAGTGGELLAVPTLSGIVRPTDIARRIVGMVPVIEAPSSTFKKPVVSGRALLYRRGATADDPARHRVQSFTTSDSTLSMVKAVINILLDSDWAGEAGLILGDAVGYIRTLIAEGVADSKEIIFLHGDTAGTHQDTISTWTMGSRYTAGALDGTDSPLKLVLGFRAEAFDRSATVAGGGTFDASDHFGALALMAALGAGARIAVGLYTFYTQLLANSLFTTVDKAGAAATLQTGQLGQIGDTPIDLSDFLAREFASTGLYTGSGTTGTMVYYNPQAYRHYVHRSANAEWDVTEAHKGAQYVGVQEEFLLDKICPAAEVPAAAVINV